ncbi:MAG: PDZ domain-containing protein [Planctomycetota bacterium]|nr:PDZ domain-containing protein [Planctomycetota bacterium]
MRIRKVALGIAGLLAIAAWMTNGVSPYSPVVFPKSCDLQTTEGEDGSTRSWVVISGNKDIVPSLSVQELTVSQVAQLGIRCSKLPPKPPAGEAAPVGVTIAEVVAGSPAELAGLAKGDLLLQIDGQELDQPNALRKYLAKVTDPTQEVELTVLPQAGAAAADAAVEPRRLQLLPEQVEVTETALEWISLRHSPGIQHYTGLQTATVPAEHARNLYGLDEPALLVTGVVGGSPAYYAGLRAGDRVLTVDGGPASLDELRVAVFDRVFVFDHAKEEWPPIPLYDLLMFDEEHFAVPGDSYVLPPTAVPIVLERNDKRATEDAPLVLEVEGPLGPHRVELPVVTGNMDQVNETNLPGILTSRATVAGTDVQFLDPGFTIGFDYRSHAVDSKTREPAHSFSLQLLPFGMFEVRKAPNADVDEVTLFWFLTL